MDERYPSIKEAAEKTNLLEQQLQRASSDKHKSMQEVLELQKMISHDIQQQIKSLRVAQKEIAMEVQKANDLKTKFGNVIAEKYQEAVMIVERSQKTNATTTNTNSKTKERKISGSDKHERGKSNPLAERMDRDKAKEGFTTLDKGRSSEYGSGSLLTDKTGAHADKGKAAALLSSDTFTPLDKGRTSSSSSALLDKRKSDKTASNDRKDLERSVRDSLLKHSLPVGSIGQKASAGGAEDIDGGELAGGLTITIPVYGAGIGSGGDGVGTGGYKTPVAGTAGTRTPIAGTPVAGGAGAGTFGASPIGGPITITGGVGGSGGSSVGGGALSSSKKTGLSSSANELSHSANGESNSITGNRSPTQIPKSLSAEISGGNLGMLHCR